MDLPPVATRGAGLCRPARGCLCGCGGWGVGVGGAGVREGRPTQAERPADMPGLMKLRLQHFPRRNPVCLHPGLVLWFYDRGRSWALAAVIPKLSQPPAEPRPLPSRFCPPAAVTVRGRGGQARHSERMTSFLSQDGCISDPPLPCRRGKGSGPNRRGRKRNSIPAEESGSERPVTGSNQGLEEALEGILLVLGLEGPGPPFTPSSPGP